MKHMVKNRGFVFALVLLLLPLLSAMNVSAQEVSFFFPLPTSYSFSGYGSLLIGGLEGFPIENGWSVEGQVDSNAHALNVTIMSDSSQTDGTRAEAQTQIRLLDNTLYADFGGGWKMIDGAGDYAANALSIFALYIDPTALAQWDVSGIDGANAILSALASADASAYLSVEKVNNAAVDSIPVVRWHSVIDLPALMRTDGFVEAVAAFASAQGNNLVTLSADELAEAVRANAALFEGSSIEVDTYIGEADSLVHRLKINFYIIASPQAIGFDEPDFTVSAAIDITLRELGEQQTIPAPDDAEPATSLTQMGFPSAGVSNAETTQVIYFAGIGENEVLSQAFEAEAGDTVSIAVRAWRLDFDPNLTLIAPDGSTLAENDDDETGAFALGWYDSYIPDVSITESGIYTAEIREFDGLPGGFALSISIRH